MMQRDPGAPDSAERDLEERDPSESESRATRFARRIECEARDGEEGGDALEARDARASRGTDRTPEHDAVRAPRPARERPAT